MFCWVIVYIRFFLFFYVILESFAFASLKVPSEFKPWFDSFQTILSEEKNTEEVMELVKSSCRLMRKSDTSTMIREYMDSNGLKNTDTFDEFLERKSQNPNIKTALDFKEDENQTLESVFHDYFFFSKDKPFLHSAWVLCFIKTLENETDALKLFSKETLNIFFLHSLYLFMMDLECADLIKIKTGNFFVDFFNANDSYKLSEYRKILKFYNMIIKDVEFVG
ncbi:MAG: hypothetical protein HEEMFOPI_01723 [Holosporales bacterium]